MTDMLSAALVHAAVDLLYGTETAVVKQGVFVKWGMPYLSLAFVLARPLPGRHAIQCFLFLVA